jgi:hypothetical protein
MGDKRNGWRRVNTLVFSYAVPEDGAFFFAPFIETAGDHDFSREIGLSFR